MKKDTKTICVHTNIHRLTCPFAHKWQSACIGRRSNLGSHQSLWAPSYFSHVIQTAPQPCVAQSGEGIAKMPEPQLSFSRIIPSPRSKFENARTCSLSFPERIQEKCKTVRGEELNT